MGVLGLDVGSGFCGISQVEETPEQLSSDPRPLLGDIPGYG